MFYDANVARQCGEKIRHVTRSSAKHHKKALRKRTKQLFNVYQCPHCGYYHVGHRSNAWVQQENQRVEQQMWAAWAERVREYESCPAKNISVSGNMAHSNGVAS